MWLGSKSALAQVAVRPEAEAAEGNVLVVIFLRGGADGLNVVVPYGEDAYHRARPTLRLRSPKESSGDRALDLDGFFGFHPSLAPILPLYKDGRLAVFHAVGSNDETRSHFEAMNAMERGLAQQNDGVSSGWLARHLQATPSAKATPLRAVAFGSTMPDSLRGATQALALQSLYDFRLDGGDADRAKLLASALSMAYAQEGDEMSLAGRETLRVLDQLNSLKPNDYQPAGGASYPDTGLGQGMKQTAFLIKAGVGLEVACLDMGGWDTHVAQGAGTGWQAGLLAEVAQCMAAFHADLGAKNARVTTVVQTEFGRRLNENTGLGTDHGHGSFMFLMGGGVQGGKVYGDWPGLEKHQLTGPGDLVVTTDYRNVLAELLQKRHENHGLASVFPGLRPSFTGVLA